ncbi:hypothetical protein GCM10023205_71320 [Yinghuangia aomiensis]|uniref:Uncharacterized protein n=1 Tax=Yinghuangia aomiensis TaxID=676205 RepID=A0ABP9I7U7_9ACTN
MAVAETNTHGFSVDFSPKEPEPHRGWTDRQAAGDYWWATFIPSRGWECGMKASGPHRPRGRSPHGLPSPGPPTLDTPVRWLCT